MRLEHFDYYLPPELIAQEPVGDRSSSRLLTLERASGSIGETRFASIVELFEPGDLLVVNDTRVIPARLMGTKESGGKVEVFLVRKVNRPGEVWHCLLRASKAPRPGGMIRLAGEMSATVLERGEGECWTVDFTPAAGFQEWLERQGSMPLPPYIRRAAEDGDRERYQTVFARVKGAVAAPTAGLHFTGELLEGLKMRG
ncbi:MAG TPA: S-adenosylmethionine:tRNA ribosyltransferase-isomerase, partial [Geobacteraceae bacterium]